MGCMLGCFGLSSKRKRRKPPSRILPRDQQGFGSYEQLDNSASADIEFNEETVKKQAMEPVKGKIRKKVSFNLNVMAYEPISSQDDEAEDGKTEEIGNRRGTTLEELPPSPAEEDPTATKMVSYPSNYRYRDCIDNYDDDDEEEEFYDESDLDSDEDYEEEEEEEVVGGQLGDIEEVRRRTRAIQDEQVPQHLFSSLQASSNSGKWQEKNDQNARERSQYIHSVLNPVENLAQWKEIKARGKQQQKKENTEPMLLPVEKVVVASSLSNWLASPPVNCQPKTGVDKSCARSWRSREESLGMTDITNLSN
ncbi:unnamed protein product [Linum tenue]|uniref:Uncharacterized protein n=1 Tax=Linum tenue TaxID=586396 RepID=A0AAV0LQS7_9ROSI|nr:unnamed protein product [Linum tenue]